jgi:hypothetical protein
MKKKNKTNSSASPEDLPPPAAPAAPAAPPAPATPDVLTKRFLQEEDPTEQLMTIVFDAWVGNRFKGLFYVMDRTFVHFTLKEQYGTHLIFDGLQTFNKGNHADLVDKLLSFRDAIYSDLKAYIADRKGNS